MTRSTIIHYSLLCGILIGLPCLFLYPLFTGHFLLFGDNFTHVAPLATFWKESILAGELPLWNPYIFAGIPFLADPAHAVFSPFNTLYLLIADPYVATSFMSLLLLTITGVGAYLLGMTLGFSGLTRFWLTLTWTFSGVMFEGINDVNTLAGIIWLPWVAAAWFGAVVKQQPSFFIVLSILLALQLLSGHSQYSFYTLVALGVAQIIYLQTSSNRFNHSQGRQVGWLIATIGLGLALAAIQIVPTLELLQQSQRSQQIQSSTGTQLHPVELVRLVLPTVYGTYRDGTSWGPNTLPEDGYGSAHGYLSLSVLVLALSALLHKPPLPHVWAIFTTALVCLVLALGDYTPMSTILQQLPGFAWFRSPVRILSVYSLLLVVLGAIGLEQLRHKKAQFFPGRYGIFALGAFALAAFVISAFFLVEHYPFILVTTGIHHHLLSLTSYTPSQIEVITKQIGMSIGISGWAILCAAILIVSTQCKRSMGQCLGLLMIITELWLVLRGNLIFAPTSILAQPSTIGLLQAHLPPSQRYISSADTQPYTGIFTYMHHLTKRPPLFLGSSVSDNELHTWTRLKAELQLLPTNTHQPFHLRTAAGYAAIIPTAYQHRFTPTSPNTLNFRTFGNPMVSDMATAYLLTTQDQRVDTAQFQLVDQQQPYRIYRNLYTKPRFALQGAQGFLSNSKISIVKDNPSHLEVTVHASDPGLLIVRDLAYPGWLAYVDDNLVTITPYQSLFRQISVPTGTHRVVFQFQPLSVTVGATISLVALGVLGGLCSRRYLPYLKNL